MTEKAQFGNLCRRCASTICFIPVMAVACDDTSRGGEYMCADRPKVYLSIADDERSVIVASPTGSATTFNVVDVCAKGADRRPVVNGFYLGGSEELAVRYSDTCVARLDLQTAQVVCLACD